MHVLTSTNVKVVRQFLNPREGIAASTAHSEQLSVRQFKQGRTVVDIGMV